MTDHRVHRHRGDLHMIMVIAYSQGRENLHRRCAEQFRHEALQGVRPEPSDNTASSKCRKLPPRRT
ncbi:hypothetical protein [Nocardia sp. CA-135398]|uniref:hypothetical protein n=1 Tax=Nocardia sp. CA-135398 TaxID=3239977 RepID=UPI003D972E1B